MKIIQTAVEHKTTCYQIWNIRTQRFAYVPLVGTLDSSNSCQYISEPDQILHLKLTFMQPFKPVANCNVLSQIIGAIKILFLNLNFLMRKE